MPTFTIKYEQLRLVALAYCGLPLVIFILLWVKLLLAIPAAIAFVSAFVLSARRSRKPPNKHELFESPFDRCTRAFRKQNDQYDARKSSHTITLSLAWIIAAALIAVVWCILGGQGGMWYQSGDWDSRNALFRDLLTHGWPVHYKSDGALLCYYVAHWLPAALVGKAALRLGFTLTFAWNAANVALLIWTVAGIFLVFLLILMTIRPKTSRGKVACFVLPIFFATPDLIGMIVTGRQPLIPTNLHAEWWAANMQFSSLTTCLFWVFNQAVIPWICTLVFINERSPSNYFLIWATCLLAGPLPAIGLAVLMIVQGVAALLESEGEQAELLKSAASLRNALSLPAIALTAVYFLSSSATQGELNATWSETNLLPTPFYLPSEPEALMLAIAFILIEALLIPILLRLSGVRGPLLVAVSMVLVICPMLRFNSTADFCMRVSIPSVLILCTLCGQVLISMLENNKQQDKTTVKNTTVVAQFALMAVLLFGAFTPLLEFYRGFDSVANKGIEASVNDPYITFEKREGWPRTNFTVQVDEDEQQPLFEFIAQ